MTTGNEILSLSGITKRFPGVVANDAISLRICEGEVVGLLGENGAGKTTLMNILYGLTQPDAGAISINGHIEKIESPSHAINRGIGMVHQHFMLIPVMTVGENMALGCEPLNAIGLLQREQIRIRVQELCSQFDLEVDPDALVAELPVGVQQRVEILKTLYRNARLLILDEPTAVLTPQEVERLFRVIARLRTEGKSVIFITHKLKEVLQVADRIVVLRAGRVVGEAQPDATSETELAELMVGRQVSLQAHKKPQTPGEVVLEAHNLSFSDRRNVPVLRNISFQVHAGEIFGIAGVQGNGQTELVKALTGMLDAVNGTIAIDGKSIQGRNADAFYQAGVGHIPEDRQKHGMVGAYSITENIMLREFRRSFRKRFGLLDHKAALHATQDLVHRFDIRTPGTDAPVNTLSGGNQQKVIAARELSRPLRVLIAAQPTRGLDIGSIEFIHSQILEQRAAGCAVVLVSTELDEILALSDRIAVMVNGKLTPGIVNEQIDRIEIGRMMAGAGSEGSCS